MNNKVVQIIMSILIFALSVLLLFKQNYGQVFVYTSDDTFNMQYIESMTSNGTTYLGGELNKLLNNIENIKVIPKYGNYITLQGNYSNVYKGKDSGLMKLSVVGWSIGKMIVGDVFFPISQALIILVLPILCQSVFLSIYRKQITKSQTLIGFFLFYPIFLFRSNFHIENTLGVLGFIIFLFLYLKNKQTKYAYLFSICLFFIRAEYLLVVTIFIVFDIISTLKNQKYIYVLIGGGFVLGSLVVPHFNYLVNYYEGSSTGRIIEHLIYIFDIRNIEILVSNIKNHFSYIFPLGILGIIFSVSRLRNGDGKTTGITLGLIFLLYFFLKNGDYRGYNKSWIASSYVRYILFPLLFACINFVVGYRSSIYMKLVVYSLLFLYGFNLIFSGGFGFKSIVRNLAIEKGFLMSTSLEEDSVLIDGTYGCYYAAVMIQTERICIENKLSNKQFDIIYNVLNNKKKNIYIVESTLLGNRMGNIGLYKYFRGKGGLKFKVINNIPGNLLPAIYKFSP